jgi:Lrp/AsnC family leucine-responsive transcriptional regulator
MDRIDAQILSILEADGRMSYASLAEAVGLSKTPCWSRVQALREAGVVRGFKAVLEPRALGLQVQAFVEILIEPSMREAFEAAVLVNASILDCFTTAGDADYIVKVACAGVEDLDRLLRCELTLLPGVRRSSTMLCLKTVKQGGLITSAAFPRPGSR